MNIEQKALDVLENMLNENRGESHITSHVVSWGKDQYKVTCTSDSNVSVKVRVSNSTSNVIFIQIEQEQVHDFLIKLNDNPEEFARGLTLISRLREMLLQQQNIFLDNVLEIVS